MKFHRDSGALAPANMGDGNTSLEAGIEMFNSGKGFELLLFSKHLESPAPLHVAKFLHSTATSSAETSLATSFPQVSRLFFNKKKSFFSFIRFAFFFLKFSE